MTRQTALAAPDGAQLIELGRAHAGPARSTHRAISYACWSTSASNPRRFRFGRATRAELAARGLYNDRGSYEAAHVRDAVALDEVVIPGRRGDELSFLLFWASVVPHVGITEPRGYFLCSFEAVAPTPLAPG